jgi:hypothetical protein
MHGVMAYVASILLERSLGRGALRGIVESGIDFCSSTVLFGHGSDGVKASTGGALYVRNRYVDYGTLVCSRSSIRVPCACELFTSNLTEGQRKTPSPDPAMTCHANQIASVRKSISFARLLKKDNCANSRLSGEPC